MLLCTDWPKQKQN